MPVIDTIQDEDTKTLTMIAQFAAPPERVWEIYADASQMEQIWGMPTYPATIVDHALEPGGRVTYYMTSPEGEKYYGFFEVTEVNPPTSFSFRDFFADENFAAVESMPSSTNTYTFTANDEGTRVVYESVFDTVEGLRTVVEMGVIEGSLEAISQVDDLLARD